MRYQSFRELLLHLKSQYEERCTSCGLCVEACPIYEKGDWQGITPQRLHEGRLAAVNDGVVSDAVYDFTFACSSCAICRDRCPEGLDAYEFTHLARMAIVDSGRSVPPKLVSRLPTNRESFLQVAMALQMKPGEERWWTEIPENPPQADTVVYLGCGIHVMPDLIYTLLDVLAAFGQNIPVVGGIGLCCGELDTTTGDTITAERSLRRLVEGLSRFRPRDVVLWCGACYYNLLRQAPQLMAVPFRTQHISRFLNDRLGSVTFRQHVEQTVTFHDPCNLGRVPGERGPVRELLSAIPGVRLVELSKDEERRHCCGSPPSNSMPQIGASLAEHLLSAAAATGSSTLATACHGCQRRLSVFEADRPFQIASYMTLLGQALGVDREDRLKRYGQYHDPERVIAEAAEYIAASNYPREELEALVRLHFR